MSKLVTENQASFIPNRHSSDNLIILQEMIHTMKRKTGRKGAIAIKIDLEKAYDNIE